METAMAAYHAGRGQVNEWLADRSISADGVHLDEIPISDTAHYVRKIVRAMETYERLYAWIFFRANDLHSAFSIIAKIFTDRGPLFTGEGIPSLLLGFMCIGILMLKEIKDEMSIKVHALNSKNYWVRIIFISLFIAFIILTASFNGGAFIYFQF